MADKDKDKCAHPNCTCHRANDSKYCSAYCEGAGDTIEIACSCGHSSCAGNVEALAG